MRPWAVLAAVAAIGLGAAAPLQPPAPAPGEHGGKPQPQRAAEEAKTNANQRGTKTSPIVVEIEPTAESKEEAAKAAEREDEAASNERGLVILTGVLSAATIVLCFATIWLGISTKRLWKSTDKAIEDARNGAETELRAYVSFKDLKSIAVILRSAKDLIERYDFILIMENTGSTQARRVQTAFGCEEWPKDAEEFVPTPEDVGPHYAMIGPRQTTASRLVETPDVLKRVADGECRLFLWAWVEYEDVFDGPVHRTEVCWEVLAEGNPTMAGMGNVSLIGHTAYNAADEDCWDKPKRREARA